MRAALGRALRALEKAKASKAELVEAVRSAARDASAALSLPMLPPPLPDHRSDDPEVAICVLSDWQLAKRTPSYNSTICEERIEEYARRVAKLTAIQRAAHPVRECRVYLLGDLLEGELVFPGQSHLADASLYRQVCVDGPRILGGLLRSLATVFERVHVVGVIGNHGAIGGRSRRDMHPESNADAMVYEIARLLTAGEPRITWAPNSTEGERHWYAIDQVGAKRFMLFHGDQIRGHAGYPWYGTGKKVQGWAISFDRLWSNERFDYALYGHFHTPNRMFLNGITAWCNGSTESHNPYALEQLAAAGSPSQWLLFCHPERGITAEYLVGLGDERKREKQAA